MSIVRCRNNKCGYCIDGDCRKRVLTIRENGACGYMYSIFGEIPVDLSEPKEFLNEKEKAEIEFPPLTSDTSELPAQDQPTPQRKENLDLSHEPL